MGQLRARSGGFTKCSMLVGPASMAGTDDRTVAPDARGDLRVANPSEGVYVFYADGDGEYIRTDCVVDVKTQW